MSKFLKQSFCWCPFPYFSSNFVSFHVSLSQCCFLPSLLRKRKHQKPLDGDRLAGLPTCFCTWLKNYDAAFLLGTCFSIHLFVSIYFFFPLTGNFHLSWAQGRGEGIPEVTPSSEGQVPALLVCQVKAQKCTFFPCSPACKALLSLFVPIYSELFAEQLQRKKN